MRIDHVIYVTADLDAASQRLGAQLGLPVAGGGRHVGLGTENRIMPLGGGYLEILAIADPEEAAGSPFGATLAARLAAGGDGLAGWAAAVDDVGAVAERLGLELAGIERDGMTARLAGVGEALAEPFLPFFIERDPGVADPSGTGGPGIGWLEVSGDAARLRAWVGEELPVRVVDGPPAVLAVGIGEQELRA